jgi:hypothetical protein
MSRSHAWLYFSLMLMTILELKSAVLNKFGVTAAIACLKILFNYCSYKAFKQLNYFNWLSLYEPTNYMNDGTVLNCLRTLLLLFLSNFFNIQFVCVDWIRTLIVVTQTYKVSQ